MLRSVIQWVVKREELQAEGRYGRVLQNNILDSGIRFFLKDEFVNRLSQQEYKFGFDDSKFGEIVYYRTYSRIKKDGTQENWLDTVLRCINGVMTIRKWWFLTNNLPWNEDAMQAKAIRMGFSMIQMKWLPPGRGLWILGSDYVYERGGRSLYNCGFVEVNDLAKDMAHLKDSLMAGIGEGYSAGNRPQDLKFPTEEVTTYVIPDTREGWVESVYRLISSYYYERYHENTNSTVELTTL